MSNQQTLLEPGPRRRRWHGTTALAIRPGDRCGNCGTGYTSTHIQAALFYHGGYGEAQQHRIRWCECGTINSHDIAPLNPRHLPS